MSMPAVEVPEDPHEARMPPRFWTVNANRAEVDEILGRLNPKTWLVGFAAHQNPGIYVMVFERDLMHWFD